MTHDLKFGDILNKEISIESFIVKSLVAQKLLAEQNKDCEPVESSPKTLSDTVESEPQIEQLTKLQSKYFSMDVELDKTRLNKSFNTYIDEIASYLMHLPNISVSIRLAVNISAPEGIPEDLKEIISENCRTLKVKNFYFENY